MRDSGMRRRNRFGGSEANSGEVVGEQTSLQNSNRSNARDKPDDKMDSIEFGGDISPEELHSKTLHDEAMDVDEIRMESDGEGEGKGDIEPEIEISAGEDCSLHIAAMQESDEGVVLSKISKSDCENQAIPNSPSKSSWQKEFYMSPNEPVFSSTMKYDNMFVFWQVCL